MPISSILFPMNLSKSLMIAETRRLLEQKTGVIAEASFSHDDNFCSVDILRQAIDGFERETTLKCRYF
ncbi:hypothetical protein FACS189491_07890 [Spirochaetia bacterium]|nr:hypothetical protein FACS189491_07890 [Spirochaetia bacterium]